MFPTEHEPMTPHYGSSRIPRFSTVHNSELSPPQSQERGSDRHDYNPEGGAQSSDQDPRPKEAAEPGWGWKNPRAMEECERSLEFVLDRNFSMRMLPQ